MIENLPREVAFPDSAAVARAAYRPRNRILDLWWRRSEHDPVGRRYQYFDVPEACYRELLAVHADGGSVGEFANHRIRPFYHHARDRNEDEG